MAHQEKKEIGLFLRYSLSIIILFSVYMLYQKKHSPETYHAITNQILESLPDGIFSEKKNKSNEPSHKPITNTEENTCIIDTKTNQCILVGGSYNITYYNQKDTRWKDKKYGKNDTIGVYGCGPTTLAMVVSSLTSTKMTPDAMATWAYQNNYFCQGSGSYHSIIPEGAKSYGLQVSPLKTLSKDAIIQELCTGKILVALMKEGHFTTSSGHFIILRSVTLDGKVLIADPQSLDNSLQPWDIDTLVQEFKTNANNGGPVWSISVP